MERTACNIVGTPLPQSDEVPYHIDYLSRIENPVDGVLWYHLLLLVHLFVFDILRSFHIHDLILIDRLLHLP